MTLSASRALWPAPFLDQRGNRRPGLAITVYELGTGPAPDGDGSLVLAELFVDDALTVPGPNPVTTDADGNETSILAAPGYYDAYVDGETIRILVVDPSAAGDAAAVAADLATLESALPDTYVEKAGAPATIDTAIDFTTAPTVNGAPIGAGLYDPSVPVVLQFGGAPGALANTTSDHGEFWPLGIDLGPFSWEFWSCNTDESITGYLLSEGPGGAHSILATVVGVPTGNVWNGSSSTSFGGGYTAQLGEYLHSRFGWDGTWIYTWINGVVVSMVPFAGPRRAQDGRAFFGGSDHSNFTGKIPMARGYEGACPRFNNVGHLGWFAPERTFSAGKLPGRADQSIPQFVAHFLGTPSARIIPDMSEGFGGSRHPGQLYGSANGVGHQAYSMPPPKWVADPTAPFGVTEPARVRTPPSPTSAPTGARIWDSVGRADSLPAFTHSVTAGVINTSPGSTEGGSIGPLAWVNPSAPIGPTGVFDGALVSFSSTGSIIYVDNGAANMDVSVDRHNALGYSSAPPTSAQQTPDLALGLRYQDVNNYLKLYPYHDNIVSNFVRLAPVVAGSEGAALGTWNLPNYTWTTLRALVSGTTVTVYADGTQIGQATGVTAFQTQTKAALLLPGNTAVRAKNILVK